MGLSQNSSDIGDSGKTRVRDFQQKSGQNCATEMKYSFWGDSLKARPIWQKIN